MADLLESHRSVLETSGAIVSHVRARDLERPTPCTGWTLGHLLAHMVGQNYGFAAAADGHSQDRAVFAKSMGIAADFDDDALRVALSVAEAVPAEAQTLDDRTPFHPRVLTTSTSLLDRVVATLGRSPDWTPPL